MRNKVAFKLSAEALHDTTGKLYLWTFTFASVYDAWHYAKLWKNFSRDLQQAGTPFLAGIWAVQQHQSHGFHYHVLLNEYLDARRVWRICRKHKMGCDAVRVKNTDHAINYVARYLSREDNAEFPIRVRRWGAMYGFAPVRNSDVQLVHPHQDAVRYACRFWGRGAFGLDQISALYSSPNGTGDYRTLFVALDYGLHRRMDAFTFTQDRIDWYLSRRNYYTSWITCKTQSVWRPSPMVDFLKVSENPF